MQLLALVWGMLAMLGLAVGFLPCLGALNWLNIPFAIIGLIISVVSVTKAPVGQRGAGTAGLVLNLMAVLLGFLRLMAGSFVL